MNLQQLRYAAAVESCGSISKAAQVLFVSQPHLSKIIKELEQELGITLFTRGPDGVTPTPEGEIFIQRGREILQQMDTLTALYHPQREGEHRFRISTIRSSLVMDGFLKLYHRYEGEESYSFSIIESDNRQTVQDVYAHNAEIGVIYLPGEDRREALSRLENKGILYQPICNLRRQIILRRGHPLLGKNRPLTKQDLSGYPMVRYGSRASQSGEPLDIYGGLRDFEENSRLVWVYDRASLHNILCNTDCFTLGTRSAENQEELFGIVSVPFKEEDGSLPAPEMGVIFLKNYSLGSIAQEFIEILRNTYGD